MESGVGDDFAVALRQDGQDPVIIQVAGPVFDDLSIGHIISQKSAILFREMDKKAIQGVLIVPGHGSQRKDAAIRKGDLLGIFF
jgi:hypothetical protein